MARNRLVALIAVTSLVWPLTLSAQRLGTVDVGVYGRYTMLDETLPIDNGPGLGGRLGLFLHRLISVEGSVAYSFLETPGGGSVGHVPWRGVLMVHAPAGRRVSILVGGGVVHNEYTRDIEGSDNGVTGTLGLRLGLSDAVFLRAEGIGDYMTLPANEALGVDDNLNVGIQLGMAVHFSAIGGGRAVAAAEPTEEEEVVAEAREPPPAPMDADGDGVVDIRDRCPGTPGGQAVDAAGCPLPRTTDADGDGVADSLDQCAGTPAGTQVDAAGCPRPPDADGDGVADMQDQCPGTAAGVDVDASGCQIQTDADGDGVRDPNDRCPNSSPGAQVDASGCPIAQPAEPQPGPPVVLEGVTFISNSAGITARVAPILNRVADSLIANPGSRIEVAGHTDNRGDRDANIELSLRRARAVVDYLVGRGVSPDRLVARGYGPDEPIADNETREGRLRNRRVELRILD